MSGHLVRLTPELIAALELPDDQEALRTHWSDPDVRRFACQFPSGALIESGAVLVVAGIVPVWRGRATAWMLISRHATRRHRCTAMHLCRRKLDTLQADPAYRRVEITTHVTFGAAYRCAEWLGFLWEGRMAAYTPDGATHDLWGRIAV